MCSGRRQGAKTGDVEQSSQGRARRFPTCLRYKRCREIFTPFDKEYLKGYTLPRKKQPNEELLEEAFAVHNCRIPIPFILGVWSSKIEFISDSE